MSDVILSEMQYLKLCEKAGVRPLKANAYLVRCNACVFGKIPDGVGWRRCSLLDGQIVRENGYCHNGEARGL